MCNEFATTKLSSFHLCVMILLYCHKTLPGALRILKCIFISVINQLDAQTFCFTISLFHASTCFEHMCSSSGGKNYISQPLVSSHL